MSRFTGHPTRSQHCAVVVGLLEILIKRVICRQGLGVRDLRVLKESGRCRYFCAGSACEDSV